ncbi:MAG: ABC transporter substrate-binding protein [Lachnospiraceae bacterium]|nr:ABC transporter substrate-binding protein [Lachnospiraceae bacterium]
MKKKFIAGILTAALALGTLTACGDSAAKTSAPEADSAAEVSDEQEEAPAVEEAADNETDSGEAETESKGTITVAASATPHAEVLEQAKPLLAVQGWDLQVTVFNDYVQPNLVVESGEFDANYFQHIPYLDSFNDEQGTHLVNAGGIHYEPFGIYPGTKSDLATLEKGDVIAVPNDTTNEARALLLLQDNGIITLKDGVGLEATVRDIVDNPNEIEIQELEAAQVPRVKDEVAFVVLNGNYALEAGFSVSKDSVAYEQSDSEAAQTYVNVIAVKEGNENNEAITALVDVLKSDEITDYINSTYDGGVIPFK